MWENWQQNPLTIDPDTAVPPGIVFHVRANYQVLSHGRCGSLSKKGTVKSFLFPRGV
jgi:dUTPase